MSSWKLAFDEHEPLHDPLWAIFIYKEETVGFSEGLIVVSSEQLGFKRVGYWQHRVDEQGRDAIPWIRTDMDKQVIALI
jgi:hypothetical protein